MQFEDLDHEESTKCNCQLLQTVQNLVNKYRSLINTESSSQIEDYYEHLSSHPSTVCGPADSAMLKALPSPEFALSEVSSRPSVHVQSRADSILNLAANGVRGERRSVDETSKEESSPACPSSAMHSPVRIVRIPNRMCPVHSRIDEHYFNGTGSALELNYDTISVTNCWQGFKFTSPSNNGSCSSLKVAPSASTANSALWASDARMSFGKFLEPFWSFVSWATIVMICGSIVFFFSREFE